MPSFTLRALRALIATADTASQNQQVTNLQNECCTNLPKALDLIHVVGLDAVPALSPDYVEAAGWCVISGDTTCHAFDTIPQSRCICAPIAELSAMSGDGNAELAANESMQNDDYLGWYR